MTAVCGIRQGKFSYAYWLLAALLFVLVPIASFAQSEGVDADAGRLVLSIATEPPDLDHSTTSDQISIFVLSHVFEGLLQYGPDGQLMPAVAESWRETDNGFEFVLRRDARWSDGKAVTAMDFKYAWQRALAPDTASQYAFILFPIAGAKAIHEQGAAADTLGVEVVDRYTLRVTLERPCPWFPSLTAFPTFYPLREDIVDRWQGRYAADADKMIYNGPFVLDRWVHGAQLRMRRNEQYWNRDAIALNEIDIPYITSDPGAQYNLFKDGQIALANLDKSSLEHALSRGFEAREFKNGTLFYWLFNFRDGRPTSNRALRKAIQSLFDPSILVYQVLGLPGIEPGVSLFPKTVRVAGQRLREHHPLTEPDRSLVVAKRWLEQARNELGGQIPALTLLAGDSPRATQEAEFLQYLLKRALGIDLRIDQQSFKQRLEKMRRGDFDIAAAGWGPDYDDALTFADLFASWNANNRGRYNSEIYDALVRRAMAQTDAGQRMRSFHLMQQHIQSEAVILPSYENVSLYLLHPGLKGLQRQIFGGDPNLRFVELEP